MGGNGLGQDLDDGGQILGAGSGDEDAHGLLVTHYPLFPIIPRKIPGDSAFSPSPLAVRIPRAYIFTKWLNQKVYPESQSGRQARKESRRPRPRAAPAR